MPAVRSEGAGAPLVAAFGHAWLRDQAFGMNVLRALREHDDTAGIVIEDWSFGTITAFQRLCELRPSRAVFVSGHRRERAPGTLHRFSAPRILPPPAEIHARVADCVMGMVSVDNLVILGEYYGVLPPETTLVEAEPVDESWGERLSPPLVALVAPAAETVLETLGRTDGRIRGFAR